MASTTTCDFVECEKTAPFTFCVIEKNEIYGIDLCSDHSGGILNAMRKIDEEAADKLVKDLAEEVTAARDRKVKAIRAWWTALSSEAKAQTWENSPLPAKGKIPKEVERDYDRAHGKVL